MREFFAAGRGKVLLFCWLGWVFDFYDLILFNFLKISIADELGLSDLEIAWILGATLGATAVGGILFGRIADRIGRRFSLQISILVFSLGMLLTAFADGFFSLMAARLVTGVGVGGEWGVGHATVAEAFPDRQRARAAGILQAGSPIAMALAAAVACFIGPEIGWRDCFLYSAVPAVLVVFARWALPGEDRAPGKKSGALLDLARPPYLKTSAALLLLLSLHMTGFWCTYAWLPSLLLKDAGASWSFVGWFQIGVNSVHVVADISFGFLADRFGRRRVFTGYCLIFCAGLLLVAKNYDSLSSNLVLFGFAMAAVGLGAGTWSCFGVLFAQHYRADVRATAASSFYNLSRGVQLFTQPMMGLLFRLTGTFAVALHVGAATAVLSAIVIWWLPGQPVRRSSESLPGCPPPPPPPPS
ncbi:MAG: MFS transporter [Planctomycetota bacterium]